MRVVILSAGKGIRMMPLTANTPKPLLKVNDKPIINYVLESLPDEIDEIIVVVKYLGDQIREHIGKKYGNKKVKYVEGSDKGNAYSFLATEPHLKDERFLLIYGDETPSKEDVKNCLTEDLSILLFKCRGVWKRDGVMVLNTDIFKYTLQVIESEFFFNDLLDLFICDHKVTLVKSKNFIGGLNTIKDLTRAEGRLRARA
jgi:glucose-1-phosphate thymidylyltransferase